MDGDREGRGIQWGWMGGSVGWGVQWDGICEVGRPGVGGGRRGHGVECGRGVVASGQSEAGLAWARG